MSESCSCSYRRLCENDDCQICFNKSFASHEKSQYWSNKNDKQPRQVFPNTNVKYIFSCPCGHEFDSRLAEITNGGWCPYCSNDKLCDQDCVICFNKSFASCEKSKFWSQKNSQNPRNVFLKSGLKYWFDCCVCNHEFEKDLKSINRENKESWCPFCSNKKICNGPECQKCFNQSFASHEKSQYWSQKNIQTPRNVFLNSNKKHWFTCGKCYHDFDSTLNNINHRENWCPFCTNKKLCDNENCSDCFNKSFASHEKSKFWSQKNSQNPREVFLNSNLKILFECNSCGHEFESKLADVSTGHWCPYCGNQKLCDNLECQSCFNKSFASHEKSQYWSNKNEKQPRDVFQNSELKYWFDCIQCGHEFDARLADINCGENWCPFCSNKKLCNNFDCQSCFNKSFASHEKSKFWSHKNNKQPRNVFLNSGFRYLFDCKCGHEFETTPSRINQGQQWCPYCGNQKLCENENCQMCFNKSFASHEKSKFWSNKNNKQPRNVFLNSGLKWWLICEKKHEFESTLRNVKHGSWCPHCVHKTETKLYEILQQHYPSLQRQYKDDWCKSVTTQQYLRFDFMIPILNIIIELDGQQHFEQIWNWATPESQCINDQYKMKKANENNFSVIRLLQVDVYYDTYDWLKELLETIDHIQQQPTIQNHYLCKNNEYQHHLTVVNNNNLPQSENAINAINYDINISNSIKEQES